MQSSKLSARTRRHILKLAALAVANVAMIDLRPKPAQANNGNGDNSPTTNRGADCNNKGTKCCFLKGTRIATPMGDIPVEELSIGDEVYTLDGIRKIKWIGYSKTPGGKEIVEDVTPVRVSRFAIDEDTPTRDLYLSPGHCLYLDGVLIPVKYVLNGASVSYCAGPYSDIEYYHLECVRHEIVFAEGLAVESYLGVNRASFENKAEYAYDADMAEKLPYAPILGYYSGFDEFKGLLRLMISNVIDVRDRIQVIGDGIDERAQVLYEELARARQYIRA